MGIRQDQCNKVCRIIDDYLANRPRERDELIVAVRTVFKEADRKTEPTMRLHEWTSDDITFCTAKCEVKCFRKPKYIKHKDIPHSFSDFSNSCVEYEPKDEPTISKMEQVDKDINVRSKDEPQTNKGGCSNCAGKDICTNAFTEVSQYCGAYEPKDEPQTESNTRWRHKGDCLNCAHWEHGAHGHYYCELLEMRQECCFESRDESTLMFARVPQTEREGE